MNSQVNDSSFPDFYDLIIDVFLCFGNDLFNPGRVNPAVLYQTM